MAFGLGLPKRGNPQTCPIEALKPILDLIKGDKHVTCGQKEQGKPRIHVHSQRQGQPVGDFPGSKDLSVFSFPPFFAFSPLLWVATGALKTNRSGAAKARRRGNAQKINFWCQAASCFLLSSLISKSPPQSLSKGNGRDAKHPWRILSAP